MNRMKNIGLILCGLVLGLTLSSPAARAVGSLKVTLSTNRILVDGKEVRLTAYNINGNNYVCLLYTSPSPRDKRQARMPSSA